MGHGLKYSDPGSTIGELEDLTHDIFFGPANGVFPMQDVVIVDAVPPEVTFVAIEEGPSPGEFATWYCDLPAVTGLLPPADFFAHQAAGDCTTQPPAEPALVTHLVWYAAQWGSAEGIDNFSVSFVTHPRADLPEQTDIYNEVSLDSPTINYHAHAEDWTTFENEAKGCPYFPSNYVELRPGDSWLVTVTAASDPDHLELMNPELIVELGPGLIYKGLTAKPLDEGCVWQPEPPGWSLDPVVSVKADGSTKLVFEWGTDEEPAFLPRECGTSKTDRPVVLYVETELDPTFPWVNGQLVSARGELHAVNRNGYCVHSAKAPVVVPAEMWTKVEPACTAEEEGYFRLLYANTGGVVLNDFSLEFEVPLSGDGSDTEVDTVFASLDAPSEAIVEYRVGGAWQATEPAQKSLVTAIRLTIPQLLPNSGTFHADLFLTLPDGVAPGTRVYGRSLIDSDELLPVYSPRGFPLTTEHCPGQLEALVFYDADGDGEWDPDEPALEDWTVVATNLDTGETVEVEVGQDGRIEEALPSGQYLIEAKPPESEGGEQSGWEAEAEEVTMESGGDVSLAFGIACTCDDYDGCTEDGCDPDNGGACLFVPTPIEGIEDACDGFDDDCNGLVDDEAGTWVAGSACAPRGTWITSGPERETSDDSATFTFNHEEGADGTSGWTAESGCPATARSPPTASPRATTPSRFARSIPSVASTRSPRRTPGPWSTTPASAT